jgi:hypothetical protein
MHGGVSLRELEINKKSEDDYTAKNFVTGGKFNDTSSILRMSRQEYKTLSNSIARRLNTAQYVAEHTSQLLE